MKLLILRLNILIVWTFFYAAAANVDDVEWNLFKKNYSKQYENESIELYRYSIWKNASKIIEEHNKKLLKGLVTYSLGFNADSDLTEDEFANLKTGFKISDFEKRRAKLAKNFKIKKDNLTLPSSIDWRDHGLVTPVKYQGSCGSCWAFAAIGALEGQYLKKMNNTIPPHEGSLSEEYYVDCDNTNYGCNGGDFALSLRFAITGGAVLDKFYPYIGHKSYCSIDQRSIVYKPRSYNIVYNENDLKYALATHGPVAVTMYARTNSFAYYRGGIYDDYYNCYKNYAGNHAAVAVGYGSENGIDYWIIKNAWGTSWGEMGFIRIRRGYNTCGIGRYGGYPIT